MNNLKISIVFSITHQNFHSIFCNTSIINLIYLHDRYTVLLLGIVNYIISLMVTEDKILFSF